MNKKIRICLFFVWMTTQMLWAQNSTVVQAYIAQYRDIAISEMQRTGIPASIKLAQGIMESAAGQSDLAIHANNHFGIKCGRDWSGASYTKEDDDFDSCGVIMGSCFRSYADATESYMAHSEFLRNPAKTSRYGFLFTLDPKDYKAWANGLKQAGYATNPKYASLLIKTIETYQLDQYDRLSPDDLLANATQNEATPNDTKTNSNKAKYQNSNRINSINDVKFVLVRDGSTLMDIASKYDIHIRRLNDYNPHITNATISLPQETKVFLQPLRKSFRGKNKWHYVKKNEDISVIAEMYAIKESSLRRRNHLEEDEQPAIGERIALRGLSFFIKKPIIRSSKKSILPEKPMINTPDDQHSIAIDNKATCNTTPSVNNIPETRMDVKYHRVEKGDTLYNISKRYNADVDTLRKLNNIDSNEIKIGQQLRLP